MFHRLTEPFGKAGLIVAVVALVAALTGGAFAATGGGPLASSSGAKHKKSKAKKGPRGPRGKTGPAGPAGPAGLPGAAGKEGPQGKEGPRGPEGPEGHEGKEGHEGHEGKEGKSGFTATLPPEETETGTWIISVGVEENPLTAISFPIPLAAPLEENEVHYVEESGNGATCPGSAEEPEAEAGNLCVYQKLAAGVEENNHGFAEPAFIRTGATPAFPPELGAGVSGAQLLLQHEANPATSPVTAWGTWAVTAPEE
jgi:Collagen triple helix repeat (20 copies)